MGSEVADELPPGSQPPPAKSFRQQTLGLSVADAAEVAVGCEVVSEELPHAAPTSGRVDLCARCGPVSWQSKDGTWVSPHCGAPARSQHRLERIEL